MWKAELKMKEFLGIPVIMSGIIQEGEKSPQKNSRELLFTFHFSKQNLRSREIKTCCCKKIKDFTMPLWERNFNRLGKDKLWVSSINLNKTNWFPRDKLGNYPPWPQEWSPNLPPKFLLFILYLHRVCGFSLMIQIQAGWRCPKSCWITRRERDLSW